MSLDRSEFWPDLIAEVRTLPTETEWIELKRNNAHPEEIGANVSAMANTAALLGRSCAYILWGFQDGTLEMVGTTFRPSLAKKGNELLESWLLRLLSPKIDIRLHEYEVDGKMLAVIEVPCASHQPVQFEGVDYIRVGSYTKRLKDFPEKERELWRRFDRTPFEQVVALERMTPSDVIQQIDYPNYFTLLGLPLADTRDGILDRLASDGMIRRTTGDRWDILNLGAILFARHLGNFRNVARKMLRVIRYDGSSRFRTMDEYQGEKGYASTFTEVMTYLNLVLPKNEVIGPAIRKSVPMYPELAVRELVANVMIHQDFTVTGTGPMIEIFADRIEITNPGKPLVDTQRFLDFPPKSRNESLAAFMRRAGLCEERGSGIDKVVFQIELYQLPAPLFEVVGDCTRAVLFGHRKFNDMAKEDRLRSCYLHACLQHVQRKEMTNATLRQRFGMDLARISVASRLIAQTVEAALIKPRDPAIASKRNASYVPFWS